MLKYFLAAFLLLSCACHSGKKSSPTSVKKISDSNNIAKTVGPIPIQSFKNPDTVKKDSAIPLGISFDKEGRICFDNGLVKKFRKLKPGHLQNGNLSDAGFSASDFGIILQRKFKKYWGNTIYRHLNQYMPDDTFVNSPERNFDGTMMKVKFLNIDHSPDPELIILYHGYFGPKCMMIVAKRINGVYRSIFIDNAIYDRFGIDPVFVLGKQGPSCIFGVEAEIGVGPESWTTYSLYKTCGTDTVKRILSFTTSGYGYYGLSIEKEAAFHTIKDDSVNPSIKVSFYVEVTSQGSGPVKHSAKTDEDLIGRLSDAMQNKRGYRIINDTFNILYRFNPQSKLYKADFTQSDITKEQFEVLYNTDEENYYSKKYLTNLLTTAAPIIARNTAKHPQNKKALTWLYKTLGMKKPE